MYKRIDEFAVIAPPGQEVAAPAYSVSVPRRAESDRIVRPAGWERRYEAAALCCDLLCLAVANLIVTVGYHSIVDLADWQMSAVLAAGVLATVFALAIQKAWDKRVLGSGIEEYRRIARAYLYAIAALAVVGYALGTAEGQSYIFGALPLALVLALVGRKILRKIVLRARREGRCLRSVLVAGDTDEVHELMSRTNGLEESGWRVEGVCLAANAPRDDLPIAIDDVPVLGTDGDIVPIAEMHKFDAVALLPSGRCTHAKTRQLSWDLEDIGSELLITPVLMDVVGPRLHISPLAGLPLLQMSAPRYSGPAWVVKNIFDRVFALLILVVIAPALAIITGVIRFESPGSVLFRQTRVGRDGKNFTMYKFRSMVADAELQREEIAGQDIGAGVLFKVRDDPRVTRVGRFIRRYSIDELPQLFNVVKGDMALVGPRPPLESEVARYGEDGAVRRLFVKPGLTGLWQVSGRSNLTWEESVRADLRYVENWTFTMDLSILRRTVGAVLRSDGAY